MVAKEEGRQTGWQVGKMKVIASHHNTSHRIGSHQWKIMQFIGCRRKKMLCCCLSKLINRWYAHVTERYDYNLSKISEV